MAHQETCSLNWTGAHLGMKQSGMFSMLTESVCGPRYRPGREDIQSLEVWDPQDSCGDIWKESFSGGSDRPGLGH